MGASTTMPATPAPWSLQRRLQGQLLGLLSLCWALSAAVAAAGLWRETGRALDDALAETAEHLLMLPESAYAGHADSHRLLARALQGQDGAPAADAVAYQVQDAQGRVLMRSLGAPAAALAPAAADGLHNQGHWRVMSLRSADGLRRVQVAHTEAQRQAVLWASARWLLGMLVLLLPLAALALHGLVKRGFASLQPARQALAARAGLDETTSALPDLRPLAASQAPQELQPWLQAVDALLARVQGLVDNERRYAARTAHELCTPLAAAMAQAQRLHDTLPAGGLHQAQCQALVQQLQRLAHLANRLLELARIESGVALQRQPVNLAELALLVTDDFAAALRSGQLQLTVRRAGVPVQGDIDALGIALRNLIDNALRHGGPRARVQVQVDGQQLSVHDNGPGSPAPLMVTRGCRQAGQLPEGPGLGLGLVATIARQSGALLTLCSPVPGAPAGQPGFRATLDFAPADDQPQLARHRMAA